MNSQQEEMNVQSQDVNDVDVVTLFDDCESGFLAKNQKLITWLLS